MMGQATQFCVGMEDKPGMLAKLCGTLRAAGVNIEALFATNDADGCWVNMVASPVFEAERTLAAGGYHFFKEKVLTLQGTSRPGELERVASRLAEAGVNINYVYGAGSQGSLFTAVLSVSDLKRAEEVLEG